MVDNKLVGRMAELYISYRKRYVMMSENYSPYVPKFSSGFPRVLDDAAVYSHLIHSYAVCVFAGKSSSKFFCFDVDNGDKDTVRGIIDKLVEYGFPREKIYVSFSGRKGYHVELFFSSLIYTNDAKKVYNAVCAELGLDKKKIEFRPTHGQSIKLPLSIHPVTHNMCWFMNPDTLEPIEDTNYLFEIQQIGREEFLEIVGRIPDVSFHKASSIDVSSLDVSPHDDSHLSITSDDYPNLTAPHTRHNTMLAIAIYERNKGTDEATTIKKLRKWTQAQSPKFISCSREEIDKDICRIADWVYSTSFSPKFIDNSLEIFTLNDARRILGSRSKYQRKFLFLLRNFEHKYGCMKLPAATIANYIGCKPETVSLSIVPNLIKDGVLCKRGGEYDGASNRRGLCVYTTPKELKEDDPALAEGGVEVGELTPDNFDTIYYTTLDLAVGRDGLKKHLSREEFKYACSIIENRKEDDGNVD